MFEFHRLSSSIRRANRIARHHAIVFALFLAAFSGAGCHTPGPIGATPEGSRPAPLRVGTSGDYAPFSVATGRGDQGSTGYRGFSIDVASAYAQDTGRPLTLVAFRWPTLRRDLEAGRFDLALSGITVRPERSIAGRFSHPLTHGGAVVLVDASDPARIRADLDRPGRRIAVNAGGHLERTARRLFPEAQLEAIPDNRAVLERFGRDGVSAVVTDSLESPHWLARRPGLRVIGPLTRDRKAAWFPRHAAEEAKRFDAWLVEAERSGRLAAMRARHGLPDARTARPAEALGARLDERLSLMIEVARTKWVRDAPVEDLAREARVLDAAVAGVARAAAALGRPAPEASAVRAFYGAQIEAAKTIQRRWIATRTVAPDTDPAARDAARARLDGAIRPALLVLGDRIADLVVRVANDPAGAPDRAALADALARHELDPGTIDALASALAALVAQ